MTGYGSNGCVVTAYDWHLAGFSHLGGCIFAGILKISGSQDFPFPAFHNEIHLGSGFVDFTHKSVQRTFLASKKQNKTTGKRGKVLEFGVWKTPFWSFLDRFLEDSMDNSMGNSMEENQWFNLGLRNVTPITGDFCKSWYSWAKPCFFSRGKFPPQWCCQKTHTTFPKDRYQPTKWVALVNDRLGKMNGSNGDKDCRKIADVCRSLVTIEFAHVYLKLEITPYHFPDMILQMAKKSNKQL